MMKCEIIRDLMPLYLDACCSEGSRKLVEEHIKECESCRILLKQMQQELVIGEEEQQKNLLEEDLLKTGKEVIRSKMREDCMVSAVWMDIPLNIFLLIFGIYTLSYWNVVNLDYSYEQISQMYWGPELLVHMYGSVGTPYMSGIALYGLAGDIKYLLAARKKCQTAILTSVTVQSILFKAIMLVTFALIGLLLVLES